MSVASRTDQPPEGTVSSDSASRRTFLNGVGLVGAAGLAAPLLARTSARAVAEGIVLGASAPGAWSPPSPTAGWTTLVNAFAASGHGHAVGCRSYRDTPFSIGADWPHHIPRRAGLEGGGFA